MTYQELCGWMGERLTSEGFREKFRSSVVLVLKLWTTALMKGKSTLCSEFCTRYFS